MEGLLSEYNLKLGVKTMVLIADVMQNCLLSFGKPDSHSLRVDCLEPNIPAKCWDEEARPEA